MPTGLLQRLHTSYGLAGDGPEAGSKENRDHAQARSQLGSFSRRAAPATTMRAQDGPSPREVMTMRSYNQQHQYYCGIDLHARSMYLHVLDQHGQTRFGRDLPAGPDGRAGLTPYGCLAPPGLDADRACGRPGDDARRTIPVQADVR
jgi:hypothetical protein